MLHHCCIDYQALNGLYSEFVVVRIACLNAVKHVPSLGRKVTGDKSTVTTLLWMALHDPDKVNQEAIFYRECFTYLCISRFGLWDACAQSSYIVFSYHEDCGVVIVCCRGCR